MERIHGLPFISGGFMAVLTGIASYAWGSDNKTTYIRMAVVMLVFYILGVYVRNTIVSINVEKEEKRERELQKELEEAEAAAAAQHAAKHAAQHEAKQHDAGLGHKVNLVADDSGEEFTPLTVSQVISTRVKE